MKLDSECAGFGQTEPPSGSNTGSLIARQLDERLLSFEAAPDVYRCAKLLIHIGSEDLARARLFEGHLNALQLIKRYGTRKQITHHSRLASQGATYGVWNSDAPDNPLVLSAGTLIGGKNFASGAGSLSRAIVTSSANDPERCQMHIVSLEPPHAPNVAQNWWKPIGMGRTDSHLVAWEGLPDNCFENLGRAGDYQREPFFSGGALRFVAAQAGGIGRLYSEMREALERSGRASHPQQTRRLARAFADAQCAYDMVLATARRYDESDPDLLARIVAVRLKVARLAERQIMRAQRAIGVRSLFEDHALCQPMTDLMTYLRQPNPDGACELLGRARPELSL